MGELIFNAIIAVVGVILFVMTYSFPSSIIDKSGGAGMFPRIVIIFLFAFLIIRTVQILRSEEERKKKFVFLEMFNGSRLIYILSTLAYFLLVKPVGFIISSVIYLVIIILYFYKLQEGKWLSGKGSVIVVICVTAGVILLDYLFCRVLGVLLPRGILGF